MIIKLPRSEDAQPRRAWVGAGALVLQLACAGCSAPAVKGYQVQAPPEGFLYAAVEKGPQGVLPDRSLVSYGHWLGDIRDNENLSTLEVVGYEGGATEREVAAARDAMAARASGSKNSRVGPLRTLQLPDSAVAWAWTEEGDDDDGRIRSLKVSAVASFDSVSFSLVFHTRFPDRMTEEQLDAVVSSFGLGRTVVYWNAVLAALAVAAVLAFLLVRQAKPQPAPSYGLWEREGGPKSNPSSPHDESGGAP